ncbi:hypothetical protein GCM10009069_05340 [Algimonas arctica]|uniref:Uncharacterized protein n=1 Tax=Algimonas arctica TaxID=1479486 RepID=A0A8J3CQM4_9PROT|nr:hypothetical protein [Algimonas arctica]GHA85154.1 hypothetical protein GCM10009069_05340 [Algimonas arctica]
MVHERAGDGPQLERGAADPSGQCGAVDFYTLTGLDLGLAVERQMVVIFTDYHMGERRVRRETTGYNMRFCWRLCDADFARPADIAGTARDQNVEVCGDHIQTLADILADYLAIGPAGADQTIGVDDLFQAGKVLG